MNPDKLTELLRKSINILMVSSPVNTSLGILIGTTFHGIFGLFAPFLSNIQAININALKLWHFLAVGVVAMNLPSFMKRKKVDNSITEAISYIEEQKRNGNIQEWQAKQMYSNLHNKVLENVMLNQSEQETSQKIHEVLNQSNNMEEL